MRSHLPVLCLFALLAQPLSGLAQPPLATQLAQSSDAEAQIVDAVYLNQTGYEQFQQGKPQAALATFRKALAIFQKYGARGGEANALSNLALVYYYSLGQSDQALPLYQQALAIRRELGDRPGEWAILSSLGEIYRDQNQYPQALTFYQQALAIVQDLGDRSSEGYRLNDLAALYFRMGQFDAATATYQQALQVHRQNDNLIDTAATYSNLGVMAANQGQYAQAIEFYQKALDLYNTRISAYQGAKATVLNNLASLYYSLGLYEQAATASQQALKILTRVKQGENAAASQVALLYSQLGRVQPLEFLPRTTAQRSSLGAFNVDALVDIGQGTTLNNLGRIQASAGQFKATLEWHQKALQAYQAGRDRAGMAIALNDLGQVSVNLKQYDRALQFYQQARAAYQETRDRAGEGVVLSNLAELVALRGKPDEALQQYQQALAIHREVQDRPNEIIALKNISALLMQQGQLKPAEQNLRQAIALLESLRPGLTDANKVALFDTQRLVYQLLQQVLVAQQQPEAALEIAERSRARAFAELLSQRLDNTPTPTVTPLNLAQIRQVAQSQAVTLVVYSILTPANSAQKQLYIWVVQPSGQIALRQVPLPNSLSTLVAISRLSLGVQGRGLTFNENSAVVAAVAAKLPTQNQQLQTLHQLLIQPITELLPQDPEAPVVFIPEGELFLVPFAALQDAQGRYLIEGHTILSAPSIQVLQLTQTQRDRLQQNPASQNALVVGNPTMPSLSFRLGEPPRQLANLPGAAAEAQAIAPLLQTQALTGAAATKATVLERMAQARIIHLATHGLLDDYKGLGIPGAIALAPSGADNGLLTSQEILTLKLRAELVVLSACDTGRGDIRGDGVIGLSRSLIAAGVPTVLVSLWKVPDEPTSALMVEFYRALQSGKPSARGSQSLSTQRLRQTRLKAQKLMAANGQLTKTQALRLAASSTGLSKAQALRQAMLKTLKQYPNPQDWAAFMLIGAAD